MSQLFFSVIIGSIVATSVASRADITATPKYFVGIVPAEDRWITLPDGKVYQGVEISLLLGKQLLDTGKVIPFLVQPSSGLHSLISNSAAPVRQAQIPQNWAAWAGTSGFPPLYSIQIKPVVETLLYVSGTGSDRFVFGFSPDHLNPYNQGRAGFKDNAFTVNDQQSAKCSKPDFFTGQLSAYGWGPFSSIFGTDFDQGATFSILGFGASFKKFQFQVIDQIRFIVDDLIQGTHDEYVYKTTAKGTDVSVSAAYDGFSLGFEIQRRTTLIAALQSLLPQVVNSFIGNKFPGSWQSQIITANGSLIMGAGFNQYVQQGLQVTTPDGDIYEVIYVTDTTAELAKIYGDHPNYVGEPVQVYTGKAITWENVSPLASSATTGSHVLVQQRMTAVGTEQMYAASTSLTLDPSTRAAAQKAAVATCPVVKPGFWEQTFDSLFIGYGFYRYENVFDQTAKPPQGKPATNHPLRVVLIDSGVDVKDKTIASHLSFNSQSQFEGFDFISWDNRPSDDNGHGTAAAKLFLQNVKKPVVLLSAKVIGPRGETSSGAIYDAFDFAVKSQVDAIIVPWSSIPSTMDAYVQGAQLAAENNIPVFVAPGAISQQKNIYIGNMGTSSFKTQGLEATVQLPAVGVGTVMTAASWINSK